MTKKKILLLEDEVLHQRLLSFILDNDFDLKIVENGQAAFECMDTQLFSPDLIIMDWIMPIMDGKSFLRMLKSSNKYPWIPVIVLSSYEKVFEEITDIPFDAHRQLHKPINPTILKESIVSALAC